MKDYRYALSLTSQFYFCGIPFRLDTTPKCSINCLYCFAMARGGRRTSNDLIINIEKLKRQFDNALCCKNNHMGINGELISRKMPVHFGGMSDPFSNNLSIEKSIEILTILSKFKMPTVLSTKNTDALEESKVLRIFESTKNIVIQVSFSTINDELAKEIEPYAPLPSKRLNTIKTLSDMGIHIIIRLQPFFPSLIREYMEDLLPSVKLAGSKHVIIEFIKIPVEKNLSGINELFKFISIDDLNLFNGEEAKLVGREWILPNKYKWETLQPIIYKIRELGMTYGSGDYGLNHLGDTSCCCGIDKIEGFTNWFKGNLSFILREAKTGYITSEVIDTFWFPEKSILEVLNSNSRIENKSSMRDYIFSKWNRPNSINSPNEYLGISWKGDYDDKKNCVYVKNKI